MVSPTHLPVWEASFTVWVIPLLDMLTVPKLTSASATVAVNRFAVFPLSPTIMSILPSERPPVIVEFTADSAMPLMERFAFSSEPPAGDHAEVSDHSHDEGRTPPSVIRVKSSADAWIAIAAAVAIAEYFNICAIKIFFLLR